MSDKHLYRSRDERLLFGVCGGVAKYLNVDPTIVRLLWVLVAMMGGPAPWVAYLVLVFVIPLEAEKADPAATKKLVAEEEPEEKAKPAAPAETKKLSEEE